MPLSAIRVGLSIGLLDGDGTTLLHAFSPMTKARLISSGASEAVNNGYVESERDRAMEELTNVWWRVTSAPDDGLLGLTKVGLAGHHPCRFGAAA